MPPNCESSARMRNFAFFLAIFCAHDSHTGAAHLFVRTQTNGSRTYLLIMDNQWVNGKVKQRVLLRLGRLDELLGSGQLDSLIQSLGRFSEKLAVLGAHARGDSITTRSARIGPALSSN